MICSKSLYTKANYHHLRIRNNKKKYQIKYIKTITKKLKKKIKMKTGIFKIMK